MRTTTHRYFTNVCIPFAHYPRETVARNPTESPTKLRFYLHTLLYEQCIAGRSAIHRDVRLQSVGAQNTQEKSTKLYVHFAIRRSDGRKKIRSKNHSRMIRANRIHCDSTKTVRLEAQHSRPDCGRRTGKISEEGQERKKRN